MGLVVLEGLIITVLVLTGFRVAVFRAIPAQLKTAIAVGIGLFLALIGLVDAGIVRRTGRPASVPVQLGIDGSLRGWPMLVFVRRPAAHRASWSPAGSSGAILIGIARHHRARDDRRGGRATRARRSAPTARSTRPAGS